MSGDNSDFAGFIRRVLRAAANRYSTADPDDLTELLAIRSEVDAAIATAVAGLREAGFSWAEIARAAGTTRQAAHERWAVRVALTAESTARLTG